MDGGHVVSAADLTPSLALRVSVLGFPRFMERKDAKSPHFGTRASDRSECSTAGRGHTPHVIHANCKTWGLQATPKKSWTFRFSCAACNMLFYHLVSPLYHQLKQRIEAEPA